MTVTTTTRTIRYSGNGLSTSFPIDFKFLDNSDIKAIITDADGVDTTLTLDSDYSVTGAGEDAGGTLTYPISGTDYLATGETLTVYREMELTQEARWENADEIDAEMIEEGDDRATMLVQQIAETLDRTLVAPITSGLSGLVLPTPSAGKALIWNETEDGLVSGTVDLTALGATTRKQEFTATSGQVLFTITGGWTYAPAADNLTVHLNGRKLGASEYTKTSASSVTLAVGAVEGDLITLASVELESAADLLAATTAAQAAQTAAEVAQAAAVAARVLAQAAQSAAETAETNAETAETNAELAETNAEAAQAAAEAAAASLNMPAISGGDAGKSLRVNTGETGYELFAPVALDGTNTWTGVQSINDGKLKLNGSTSGATTIKAAAVAGTTTSTLPDADSILASEHIRQVSKSEAYTCVLADAGKHIYHPSADTTARTWTIPANASVAYPIGTTLTFVNDSSAGVITIAITTDTLVLAGSGTTGSRTLAANGIATALKVTATRWIISGTGLS